MDAMDLLSTNATSVATMRTDHMTASAHVTINGAIRTGQAYPTSLRVMLVVTTPDTAITSARTAATDQSRLTVRTVSIMLA